LLARAELVADWFVFRRFHFRIIVQGIPHQTATEGVGKPSYSLGLKTRAEWYAGTAGRYALGK